MYVEIGRVSFVNCGKDYIWNRVSKKKALIEAMENADVKKNWRKAHEVGS